MSSLYEINEMLVQFLTNADFANEQFCNSDGEVLNLDEIIDMIDMSRKDKMENIALFIKNLESDAEQIKQEEETLKERRQAKERKAEGLRTYLAKSMTTFGDTKIETPRCLIGFRKSEQVNLINEELIPDIYKTKVETVKVNKTDIKTAIKSGIKIEGAELVEKQNLQIK